MGSSDESCLIGGIEQREIVIVDYDPAWPSLYKRHAGVIGDALGGTLLRIEYIGSTFVPGLAAKPIIDILAVVPDSADESSYVPQLEAAGYVLRVREPDFYEHRMLRTAARDVHVHVYSPGTPEISSRELSPREGIFPWDNSPQTGISPSVIGFARRSRTVAATRPSNDASQADHGRT
jgi:hypothetical protein